LRAFVGQTAFEDLCREWVVVQGRKGHLPFAPEIAGSHWSAGVQADVVAINWPEKQTLIGGCQWGADGIDRQIGRDLVEDKIPKVTACEADAGKGWQIHPAIFPCGGIISAARTEMEKYQGIVVDKVCLDQDLKPD